VPGRLDALRVVGEESRPAEAAGEGDERGGHGWRGRVGEVGSGKRVGQSDDLVGLAVEAGLSEAHGEPSQMS
jgi:hypothetical protein